jgi:AcrR family transcriptional regulator
MHDLAGTHSATASDRSSGEVATHIARVAARLFAERGYDATSVREIVEAAGVTKPTLYYHFASKQGLAEALLTNPMKQFIGTLRKIVDDEVVPFSILRSIFQTFLDFITQEPDRGRFLYALCFGPQNSSLREEMHQFGESIEGVTADCARRLAEAGVIESSRVDACSQVIRDR